MTIDEAIEILKLLDFKRIRLLSRDEMDAIHLGIEALKAYQQIRPCLNLANNGLLPGETKDSSKRQG